jgi:hypothetical protein
MYTEFIKNFEQTSRMSSSHQERERERGRGRERERNFM